MCVWVRNFLCLYASLWWLTRITVDLTEEIPRLITLSSPASINLLNRVKTLVQKYQLYQPVPSHRQKPHTTPAGEQHKGSDTQGQPYGHDRESKWKYRLLVKWSRAWILMCEPVLLIFRLYSAANICHTERILHRKVSWKFMIRILLYFMYFRNILLYWNQFHYN